MGIWDYFILNRDFTEVLGMSVPKALASDMLGVLENNFCFVGVFWPCPYQITESSWKFTQMSSLSTKTI